MSSPPPAGSDSEVRIGSLPEAVSFSVPHVPFQYPTDFNFSEESITIRAPILPLLDHSRLSSQQAAFAEQVQKQYLEAEAGARDLLRIVHSHWIRIMRNSWMQRRRLPLLSDDSKSSSFRQPESSQIVKPSGFRTSQSEPEAPATGETSVPSSQELSTQIEILNAQLRDLEERLTLQRNDPLALPTVPVASDCDVFPGSSLISFHSQHPAEASSVLNKTMEQIKTCVLSGSFSAANLPGADECLIGMACGFLRRDEKYLEQVFRKHCNHENHQSGQSPEVEIGLLKGLLKENMRAALKDAHFPLVSGALAASDDDLMKQVDVDSSGRVSFEEFRQFVLQRGSVENWMKTEQFLQILSDSVVPLLCTDGGQDDQMRRLAQLSTCQLTRALDVAVIGFTMQFEESQERLKKKLKAVTGQTERLSQSKFEVSKLACGTIDDFHKGLESRIGKSFSSGIAEFGFC